MVQLGQSPDAWYYVDACRGSGYTDADFKTFTFFNDEYFSQTSSFQLGALPR